MRAGTRLRQEFTCHMGWVKLERIRSEESGIYADFFEGSVIVRLGSESIVVESGISDGYFEFTQFLVHFFLG